MSLLFTEQQLSTPISILEKYGVSLQTVNAIEDRFHAMCIRDIAMVTRQDLISVRQFSDKTADLIIEALGKWYEETKPRPFPFHAKNGH